MRNVVSRHRVVGLVALVAAAGLLLVVTADDDGRDGQAHQAGVVPGIAPGSDGLVARVQDPGQDEDTTTTTDAPTTTEGTTTTQAPTTSETSPTTDAPTTTGADTTAPGPSPATTLPPEGDGGDDDVNWLLVAGIAGLAVLALLVLAVVVGAARRRAQESRVFSRRLAEVVGRAEWIHDEGSLEVLGASSSPDRLQMVWHDTSRRLNDTGAHASSLAAHTSDADVSRELHDLSHALSRLAGALDTHVSLHLQMSDDPSVRAALEGATETVMQRREELAAALRPLAARV